MKLTPLEVNFINKVADVLSTYRTSNGVDSKINRIRLPLINMFDELKQRALKITEALYRTTDLFSDAEPLKWALRKEALEVLNVKPQDVVLLEATVKNILLKLELAACGTFISKKNFDVLGREYKSLLEEVMSGKSDYRHLLDTILMDIKSNGRADTSIGHIEVKSKSAVVLKPSNRPTFRSGRQETLISTLKEKGRLSVGDLAKALGEPVSDKTVQRELTTLVASGAVKQDGDKRWRRYFI
ncbi:MAG: hypothetical protein UW81_C0008G0002 [Candidatus Giovannonibacteria bacterium GW2011_GWC2_44_9]|uniref:HTH deoR-type domain-containing protein n=3 Tax=Candidatus Giovannoniibacteriota TaxID=1752738 RepID=A0A0G1LWU6_9BACT|nr:MAG: hypothetical protein UW49_C0002G0069 [Candidatus Giovannonibacteria bacterium GW2011_GWB1_44_23]KKT64189.1 MAG: hypothetical protein UW57_C0002G0069 [Candidatus Giovannonibacteria bacterium GW2011_GWA1_44_29]KKT83939.1 MAG: hypothetical protein UW81_C0008G0002 [Candidatus Giovannonibacteria bacterium GW2011_GWC2_44_9]KKT91789.1 MAG: hypothetical protein UW93_C0003G0069 [Parcubacteria group bacterium GW2011_GWC1_45_13]